MYLQVYRKSLPPQFYGGPGKGCHLLSCLDLYAMWFIGCALFCDFLKKCSAYLVCLGTKINTSLMDMLLKKSVLEMLEMFTAKRLKCRPPPFCVDY